MCWTVQLITTVMDDHAKSIKKALIKSSDAIRRKYQIIKSDRYKVDTDLEKNLKPITKPLKKLVNKQETLNTTIKSEFKNIKEESKINDSKFENGLNKRKLEDKSSNYNDSDDDDEDEESQLFQSFSESSDNEHDVTIKGNDKLFLSSTPIPFKSSLYKAFLDKLTHSSREIDTVFGPRSENEIILLGNYVFHVNGDIINIESNQFKATRGLYELIFLKDPVGFDKNDLLQYEKILKLTSAHRRNYNPTSQINGNKSNKYINIIGKMFNIKSKSTGMGMRIPKMMKLENNISHTNLVYWDNCNQLIERLQLLMGSKMAGHTSHNNEIISIISELREAKIIE